ncbi:unnamed protein product [Linum trigynum]|uniref:GRAM domain-containing protein n=1 Tax=Linum trigynum TaxID=586398 RepID=A0AAV2EPK5_9ROSI
MVKKPYSAARYLTAPADQAHCPNNKSRTAIDSQGLKRGHDRRREGMLTRITSLGKKADSFDNSVKEHVRLGLKISETMKGKLSLGAKLLQGGVVERILRRLFSVDVDEKLLKASQCYLSTMAGPIAGLLFISSCSERSIKFSAPDGESIRVRYKVLIPRSKMERISESANA